MSHVLTLFEEHCSGKSNVIYDCYIFNKRDQEAQELFEKYLTTLRELVGHCHLGPMLDELLCDRIVCGVKNSSLHKQLLEKKGLMLHTCVDMCRASEITAKH